MTAELSESDLKRLISDHLQQCYTSSFPKGAEITFVLADGSTTSIVARAIASEPKLSMPFPRD